MNIEIETYWNVETLYYVFNAVASVMAGAGFAGLLKMVFLFALGIGMFTAIGSKQYEMGTWFIHALIFVTVLNMPIATVILKDRTNLEPPKTVSHVPFALAIMAQTANLTFGYFTRTYETVFGVPEELGLQKGDVGFGHRILKQVNRATITEPGLRADLMQYIKECTLYDIKDGVIKPEQIVGQVDTWNIIFDKTSPARFVTYNTLQNSPTTNSCLNTGMLLKVRVNDAEKAAQAFYGKNAFPRAASAGLATSLFLNSVAKSYYWILDNSQSSSVAMRQAMFNNIWKDAGSELPALMNDPARIAEVNAMAGAAQAARQSDGSNSTLSLLAQETLPHMRNWIEAIIYALFPIIVVLMVVVSTEGAKKILGGYFMTLAWIGLWPVLFAIINHLSLMHLHHKLKALSLAEGVPFQLMDVFDATLSDEQAMIGYMVVLVPFIAGGIIKLGQGGFMGVADRMMTGFSASGAAAGSSVASGNYSMGQTGMDTASANTTTMQKYNSHIGLSGGGSTIDRPDGSVGTLTANGSFAQQSLRNQMLTSAGYDERSEASQNQEAHSTRIISEGNQTASSQSTLSSFTRVIGHDNTRGTTQNRDESSSVTEQGSVNQSYSTGEGLSQTHGRDASFSRYAGANDSLGLNLGVNRGVASSGGGGGKYSPREANRIAKTMKRNGASQSEIDKALHNYQQQSGPTASRGINAGIGLNSQKTYDASHDRTHHVNNQHTQDEHAQTEQNHAITGTHSNQSSRGEQSSQLDRDAREASRTSMNEHSTVNDISRRNEQGTGDRVSRSRSKAFTIHKDLLSNPQLLKEVARRHGMNAVRFASLPEDTVTQMVLDHVAEKEMIQQTRSMPTTTLSGHSIPTIENKRASPYRDAQAKPSSNSTVDFTKQISDIQATQTVPVGDITQMNLPNHAMTASQSKSNDTIDFTQQINDIQEGQKITGVDTTHPLPEKMDHHPQRTQGHQKLAGKESTNQPNTNPEISTSTQPAQRTTRRKLREFNLDASHQENITKTGYTGTAPLNANIDRPDIIDQSRKTLTENLNSSHPNSISARSRTLRENVHGWASPDKAVGEGRANPMGVVEDMQIRDVKDYARKVYDKFTGGDGTADGEKLNANMKSETGTPLKIQHGNTDFAKQISDMHKTQQISSETDQKLPKTTTHSAKK